MPDWLGPASVTKITNTTATVSIRHNNPAKVWEVQQITVNVGPNSTAGNVGIFKNGSMVTPTSALTPSINAVNAKTISSSAAGLPYMYIQASDEIEVIVTSATNGDTVTVRAQYREIDSSDPLVRGM